MSLTELSVVEDIEDGHGPDQQLEEWGDPHPLRLHVLVLPPPPGWKHLFIFYFIIPKTGKLQNIT